MKLPRAYIIYRGPSLLNGAPIVCVVLAESHNAKTGPIGQAYILPDHGDRPVAAIRNGSDESVCGDCKHRPVNAGTCYVVVRQGTTRIWLSLTAGAYRDMTKCVDLVSEILSGCQVRLGAYGDPAAVPVDIWRELTRCLAGWVGDTHQWHRPAAQPLRDYCMASVDSVGEMLAARSMGWRTFRVRTAGEALEHGEAVCPASGEGGHKLVCATCGVCDGNHRGRRGGVAILLHGNHLLDRTTRFNAARHAAREGASA